MANLQSTSAIEKLPANIKQDVIDKLIAGTSTRAVSTYLATKGYNIGFTAIARYTRNTIKPALKMSAKLSRLDNDLSHSETTVVDKTRVISATTNAALAAGPILARLDRKFARLDKGLVSTSESGDYDSQAKLEAQESKAIELLGKATLDPGFVQSAQPASSDARVIIVMPMANDARLMAWQAKQREAEEGRVIEVSSVPQTND